MYSCTHRLTCTHTHKLVNLLASKYSLVPRPFSDFILQLWRKCGRGLREIFVNMHAILHVTTVENAEHAQTSSD